MNLNEIKVFLDKLELGDDVFLKSKKYKGVASFLSRNEKFLYCLEDNFFKISIEEIIEIKMS